MSENYDITDNVFIRHVSEDDPDAIEPDVIIGPDEDDYTYSQEVYDTYGPGIFSFTYDNNEGFMSQDFIDILDQLASVQIHHDPSKNTHVK